MMMMTTRPEKDTRQALVPAPTGRLAHAPVPDPALPEARRAPGVAAEGLAEAVLAAAGRTGAGFSVTRIVKKQSSFLVQAACL